MINVFTLFTIKFSVKKILLLSFLKVLGNYSKISPHRQDDSNKTLLSEKKFSKECVRLCVTATRKMPLLEVTLADALFKLDPFVAGPPKRHNPPICNLLVYEKSCIYNSSFRT